MPHPRDAQVSQRGSECWQSCGCPTHCRQWDRRPLTAPSDSNNPAVLWLSTSHGTQRPPVSLTTTIRHLAERKQQLRSSSFQVVLWGRTSAHIPRGENNAANAFSTKKGSLSATAGPGTHSCLLPVEELLVGLAIGKACPPHPDVLQQAEVLHLVPAALLVKQLRGLLVIGLDATDVIGLLTGQSKGTWFRRRKSAWQRVAVILQDNVLGPQWGLKLTHILLSIASPHHAPGREGSSEQSSEQRLQTRDPKGKTAPYNLTVFYFSRSNRRQMEISKLREEQERLKTQKMQPGGNTVLV